MSAILAALKQKDLQTAKKLIQNGNESKDNITLVVEENEIWFITHLVSYENQVQKYNSNLILHQHL